MGTLNEDLTAIKAVEDTLINNKVARFAYTDLAYANNDANGVADYDVNQEQNIPVATPSVIKVNDTVLSKGYRAQASSVTRMLLNHFLGRLSYNLNKVNDNMSNLLATLISHRGTANGLATLDTDGRVPYSQLPIKVISIDNTLTVTGAPAILAGDIIEVLFTEDITGTDDTTAMSISYNGTSYTVKVIKEGVLSDFVATELTSGNFTYVDAYKYVEFMLNANNQFVILGNPIVLSGEDYALRAGGYGTIDSVKEGDMNAVTSNAVAKRILSYGVASPEQPSSTMFVSIDASYNNVSNYQPFSGSANTAEEGAWIGYKHSGSGICIFYNRWGIRVGRGEGVPSSWAWKVLI